MIQRISTALAVLLFAFSAATYAADDHPAPAKADHGAPAAHGAEAGHGDAGGHADPKVLPMTGAELEEQAPLAIWSFVVFMVLLLLATKFGWKPIVQAMHDREHHLEACLHDTEKARNEAEGLLRQYKAEMASASDKIKALLDEARRDAQTTSDNIISKAQSESEALKARAERDILQAKDEALVEIWSKAADVSVQIAGKVLQKNLSADDHKRMLDLAASELPDRSAFGFSTSTGSGR
ncbi:MAG: F0F1 ATP synthase subunit B [Planctomycetia bacterium]